MKKGFAIALLAVFALVLGGAGCCQKWIDQCKMYNSQSKASFERAQASSIKAEAAAKDAKVPVPRAAAAANKAEAAAARAEDAAAKVCAMVPYGKVRAIKIRKYAEDNNVNLGLSPSALFARGCGKQYKFATPSGLFSVG